jgi:Nucleotidyl transferase AbiEii toxin, Type IV TA system
MAGDVDHVPALSLTHLGLDGPATIACVAARWQIVQKVHACTERPADRENDRFRDLIDLQILGNLIADDSWQDLRGACVAVFEHRARHEWPPVLATPGSWADGYRTLATETEFIVTDIHDATVIVQSLIARIETA